MRKEGWTNAVLWTLGALQKCICWSKTSLRTLLGLELQPLGAVLPPAEKGSWEGFLPDLPPVRPL